MPSRLLGAGIAGGGEKPAAAGAAQGVGEHLLHPHVLVLLPRLDQRVRGEGLRARARDGGHDRFLLLVRVHGAVVVVVVLERGIGVDGRFCNVELALACNEW